MFVKARERFPKSFAKMHQKRASRYHEALLAYLILTFPENNLILIDQS